ncbi:hypothetical protein Pan153_41710 [Gimesia panareensis]|uniref:Uncharacterized protein n=1 Tax=Gimesia panareensis TaxID=2527978 RepID=A0A518FT88_9PLAN|nr:hypothetical protein [Gimesia panareensis]QDV19505.1 hypothetical protein Pan153_41710 [Gimesia panareensis]
MEKVTLSAIIFLVILIAILFITPDDAQRDGQQGQGIEMMRHASDLMNVHDVKITPEGVLQMSYVDETGYLTSHHFINLKSGNVILVEDEEFAPERVMLTDTLHGGLKVTVAKSLNLNLPPSTAKTSLSRPPR